MPPPSKSPIDELREGKPQQFVGNRFTLDNRMAIKDALRQAARRRTLDDNMLDAAILRIEDNAMDYLGRKAVLSSGLPPRGVQREQLERLSRAKPTLFSRAATALHPLLWASVAIRAETDNLPQSMRVGLWSGPDGLDQKSLTELAPILQTAAKRVLRDFQHLRSRTGPREHILVQWFAWALIPIYEEVTGRTAHAYYSESYEDEEFRQFKGRSTPFVKLLVTCLEPIDPDAVANPRRRSSIAEAIHTMLRERHSRGHQEGL